MAVDTDVAILQERITGLMARVEELEKSIHSLEDKASKLTGGVLVILALGSLGAFTLSSFEKISKWLH